MVSFIGLIISWLGYKGLVSAFVHKIRSNVARQLDGWKLVLVPQFLGSKEFLGRSTSKNMAAEAGLYDQELTYQGFNQDHFEGQSTKRKKLDDGSALPITSPENPHYAPPSKVIHVRSVSEAAREQDIVRAIGEFGRIRLALFLFFIPSTIFSERLSLFLEWNCL